MLSQAAAPLGSRLLLHSAAAAAASSAAASAPCAGLASRRFGATRSWGLTAGPAVTAAPSSLPLHLRNLHSSPDSHHGSGAVTPDPSSGGAAAARAGPAADADPAATGTAPTPSPGRGDPGFSPGWTLTLERGIGKSYGKEAELQATAAFRAEVFPDLPIATTWQNWVKAIRRQVGLRSDWGASLTTPPAEDPSPPFTHYATRPGAQKVITVAANLRSHPVRTLPGVASLLRSSLDTLRIADRLRQRGYIPPCTQLWVVANPNTERGAGLLERKVLAHGGVAGLHVMPIGKASKALALRMLAEGALPPSV
eukprot:XP_001695951.1 predicted protein [Chlamydomonas reinhardtii]